MLDIGLYVVPSWAEFFVSGDKFYKMTMKKKIGIIGSGNVAKALGNGFTKYNYPLMMGTSQASKLKEWNEKNPSAQIGSFQDAVNFADVIVLAVKGDVAVSVIQSLSKSSLKGKTIIDTTNPIDHSRAPQNGVLPFFTDLNQSLLEKLQAAVPEANFVKSFSCVGNAFMVDPDFNGLKPSMFICGNNDLARAEVSEILKDFHWEIEDFGKAESARAIEPLCMLWCIPGIQNGKWSHAFKLLKK